MVKEIVRPSVCKHTSLLLFLRPFLEPYPHSRSAFIPGSKPRSFIFLCQTATPNPNPGTQPPGLSFESQGSFSMWIRCFWRGEGGKEGPEGRLRRGEEGGVPLKALAGMRAGVKGSLLV